MNPLCSPPGNWGQNLKRQRKDFAAKWWPSTRRKAPNVGAGASGIWEHREETQRPLHETMRLAEAWLMRHAPGGSMPSQTLKHCKIQSRKDAPKMAILEAPCAQNAPGRSTMRLPEALLPRNPTWESSHFWGPPNSVHA